MGRIIVSQFITLDGVVQDPGGCEDFAQGGWSFASLNDEYFNYKHTELFSCGALLMGRITFQALETARPSRSDVTGIASRMDSLTKYVVSSTLLDVTWRNTILIRPPVITVINEILRTRTDDILVVGSKKLVRLLMKHDLIDEYRLLVHPLVLGPGQKLFDEGDVKKLILTGTRPFATGVVVLTYVPDRSKVVALHQDQRVTQTSSSSR
jgi:dihydrofolate reductase